MENVLTTYEYKETKIPTSEENFPQSPSHTTLPQLHFNPRHFPYFPNHTATNQTNMLSPIRTYKKASTPSPHERRSISPFPKLAEMWEMSTKLPPQAVYTANFQTRAQAQKGRSVATKPNIRVVIDNSKRYFPLNQLGSGQTSPRRSCPFQGPNQPSAAQGQEDPK